MLQKVLNLLANADYSVSAPELTELITIIGREVLDYETDYSKIKSHFNSLMLSKEAEIEEKFYIKPEDRAQGKTSPYAFRVKKMMLLGNVTESYLKGFSINISTPMLSQEFRERLVKMLKQNKGNTPLSMFLYDPDKGWNIEFLSRKFKVAVSAPFIEELQKMGIRYNVLKK